MFKAEGAFREGQLEALQYASWSGEMSFTRHSLKFESYTKLTFTF